MATIRAKEGLTFEDVLLVPQFSDISSRTAVDTSTVIAGMHMRIPIISANMDSITELDMAEEMSFNGGLGILHRFAEKNTVESWIKTLIHNKRLAVPSVGIAESDLEKSLSYIDLGVDAVCIDVAHGAHMRVQSMIKDIKKKRPKAKVIAGNVATRFGAEVLLRAGADVIKVGVGPGSLCTTRIQTGCGVPQLTAIMDIAELKNGTDFQLIADGGIKYTGDITKALAAGADAVMIGSIFAGCFETPFINGKKVYRGMASREAQMDIRGRVNNDTPEGVAKDVALKGPVCDVLKELLGGLRSGMSYCAAANLKQLNEYAEFIRITRSGWAESLPHGLK